MQIIPGNFFLKSGSFGDRDFFTKALAMMR